MYMMCEVVNYYTFNILCDWLLIYVFCRFFKNLLKQFA